MTAYASMPYRNAFAKFPRPLAWLRLIFRCFFIVFSFRYWRFIAMDYGL